MDGGAWWDTVHGVKKELDMTEQLNNSWIIILYFGLQSNATLFSCSTRSHFGDWEFFSWLLCLFATAPTHPFVHGWVYVCMLYILLQAHLTCLLFQTENQRFSEELRLLSLARSIIRNQGGLPW